MPEEKEDGARTPAAPVEAVTHRRCHQETAGSGTEISTEPTTATETWMVEESSTSTDVAPTTLEKG